MMETYLMGKVALQHVKLKRIEPVMVLQVFVTIVGMAYSNRQKLVTTAIELTTTVAL